MNSLIPINKREVVVAGTHAGGERQEGVVLAQRGQQRRVGGHARAHGGRVRRRHHRHVAQQQRRVRAHHRVLHVRARARQHCNVH